MLAHMAISSVKKKKDIRDDIMQSKHHTLKEKLSTKRSSGILSLNEGKKTIVLEKERKAVAFQVVFSGCFFSNDGYDYRKL